MTPLAHPKPDPAEVAEALLRVLTKLYVASRHTDMARRAAGQLTTAQYEVMQIVVERGRARVSELAQAAGVTLPTMSVAVSRLTRRELICRTSPTVSRRNSYVELTARGAQSFDAFLEAHRRAIESRLQCVSGEDQAKLRAAVPVLRRMVSGISGPADRITLSITAGGHTSTTPSEKLWENG